MKRGIQQGYKHVYEAHEKFMQEAVREALDSLNEGGYPIGAVLVENEIIVARGHNRWVQQKDPTAHGEIDCFRNAGRLKFSADTVLYTTHLPCDMCAGAMVNLGIKKVVAGDNRTFQCSTEYLISKKIEFIELNLEECFELMEKFKQKYPELWQRDLAILCSDTSFANLTRTT